MSIIRTNGTPSRDPSPPVDILQESRHAGPIVSRENVTLSGVITSVRRHALLVLLATGVVGSLAVWAVLREPLTYRASAVLRLTDARQSITRNLGEGTGDRSQTIDPLQSQVQLLKSRALIGSVVDSEGLRLHPLDRGFSPALLSAVHIEPAVLTDTFFLRFSSTSVTVRNGTHETRVRYNVPYRTVGVSFAIASKPDMDRATLVLLPREKSIDRFLESLRVSAREETDVVDVSYAAASPQVAQRVVNRLVTTFQNDDVRQAQGKSRRRRVFLEEQLREVNSQLAGSEAALSSFRSREQVFSSRDKMQAQQAALLALDMRGGELDADRRTYESLLTTLQDSGGARNDDELRALISAPGIGANPVVSRLYQQLDQYQTTRDSLTTGQWRSATNNPDVTRLDQLIAASQQRLVNAVRGHITTVDARREALTALRTRTATAIGALPRAESAEERLSRQVESNRTLADRLRDDYQKARMAEAVEAGQVEIVDLASLPYQAVARLRTLRMLLGALVGFAIGSVCALLIDSRNGHIRGRPDLEEEMRLPVLSVIPPILAGGHEGALFSRMTARLHHKRQAHDQPALYEVDTNPDTKIAEFMSPAGAEAFRLLRSSLKWTQRDGPGKTFAISSALPKEGKTTTSANLAAVCALEGKRVLLIDCDFRRPRLHQVFRLPRTPGLTQVLRAGLSPAVAVRSTFMDGVSLLPAGSSADRFADMLGSDHMRSLLDELSEHFDMIVLDTPPVLAVADAAALAPLVDGVLLVVGAGATNRHAIEQALQQLESVGARVVGAVLNDSRGEMQRYAGKYEYYYPYRDDYTSSTATA